MSNAPLETRVELLEKATLTVIHNQDKLSADMNNQFAGLRAELADIKHILLLLVETVNTRLPGQKEE